MKKQSLTILRKHKKNIISVAVLSSFLFSMNAQAWWIRGCDEPGGNCSQPFSEGLALVEVGSDSGEHGQWGFIDKQGRVAIQPLYSDARSFMNHLAAVESHDQWGYIDDKGTWVITPHFSRAYDFSDQGTALVEENEKLELIDRTGKVLKVFSYDVSIPHIQSFVKGSPFITMESSFLPALWNVNTGEQFTLTADQLDIAESQDGLIPVEKRYSKYQGSWGYMDSKHNWVIDPASLKTDALPIYYRGVLAVRHGEKWYFVDKTGTALNKQTYSSVQLIWPGTWLVQLGDDHQQILNEKLQVVLNLGKESRVYDSPYNGWVTAESADTFWLIGGDGVVKSFPHYKAADSVYENGYFWLEDVPKKKSGRSAKSDDSDEYSYGESPSQILNVKGEALLTDDIQKALKQYSVSSIRYGDGKKQASGMPIATLSGKKAEIDSGIITPAGKIVTNPEWDSFDNGWDADQPLIVKTKDQRYGTIDQEGKWIIPPIYTAIYRGQGDYAWADYREEGSREEKTVLINRQGQRIEVPEIVKEYRNRQVYSGRIFYSEKQDGSTKLAIWDIASGHALTKPEFDQIEEYENGFAIATQNGKAGIIDLNGHWVIPPEYENRFKRLDEKHFIVPTGEIKTKEGSTTSLYSIISVDNGKVLIDKLREEPTMLAPNRYEVEPITGGLAIIDETAKIIAKNEGSLNLEETNTSKGDWKKVKFSDCYGVMNAQGEWQISPQFENEIEFSQPLAMAKVSDTYKQYVIDAQGHQHFADHSDVSLIAGAERITYHDNNETVLADKNEREISRFEGEIGGGFSEGLAIYFKNEKSGFINEDGKRVVAARFDRLGTIHDNRAPAVLQSNSGGLSGYIDHTGRFVIAPQFDQAESFSEERALVTVKGEKRFIDQDGKTVVAFKEQCGQLVLVDAQGKYLWPEQGVVCNKKSAPAKTHK